VPDPGADECHGRPFSAARASHCLAENATERTGCCVSIPAIAAESRETCSSTGLCHAQIGYADGVTDRRADGQETMRYLLTTDVGIEAIAADEVADETPASGVQPAPYGVAGLVRVESAQAEDLLRLTTIHHVIEIRGEAEVVTLDDVRRAVDDVELAELAAARSFRVTTEHACGGDLARRELQGAAGAVIQRRYGTPVDLEGFEVNVRVELFGTQLVVGLQRTTRSLGKRLRRSRELRTGIKPTVAAAMIRLAGAHEGRGRLIDPLCGAGTIPIEARRINPELAVVACDWDEETVATARGTAENAGVELEVRQVDARELRAAYAGPFDYIVTDPPYGVRLGKRSSLRRLYPALLRSFEQALADSGRIVLVALKLHAFRTALDETSLRVVCQRRFCAGQLAPHIFVLERA